MHSAGKPVWQQLTALVSLGASGAVTGFTFSPRTPADLTSPASLPVHLLALAKAARPAADDATLRSAIVNVAHHFLRMAQGKTPAQMESIIWHHDSVNGADHGQSCAAFASLTLELAAQAVGQQSWVTGGTSYPWPLHKWADARVDPNPASPGIISVLQDAKAHHRWHPLGDGYQPLPGDWVLFPGHIEVVTRHAGGALHTIGGDSLPDFSVNAHQYHDPLGALGVTGFVNNGSLPPAAGPGGHHSARARDHQAGPARQPAPAATTDPPAAAAGPAAVAGPAVITGPAAVIGSPAVAGPSAVAGPATTGPAPRNPYGGHARGGHAHGGTALSPAATAPATDPPAIAAPQAPSAGPPTADAGPPTATAGIPAASGGPAPAAPGGATSPRAAEAEPAAAANGVVMPGLPTPPAGHGRPGRAMPGPVQAHGHERSAGRAGTHPLVPGASPAWPAAGRQAAEPRTAPIPGLPIAPLRLTAGAARRSHHIPAVRLPVPGTPAQQAFINEVAPGAIDAQRRYGVPASVTIAQAIVESGWGQSQLASQDHNLFGIKGTGPDGSVREPSWEQVKGQAVMQTSAFRVYHSAAESIDDHGRLLATSTYYRRTMSHRRDPNAFAASLTGIYATDPEYGTKLISLMRRYNLYRYDITPASRPAPPDRGSAGPGPVPPERGSAGPGPVPPVTPPRPAAPPPASPPPASPPVTSPPPASRPVTPPPVAPAPVAPGAPTTQPAGPGPVGTPQAVITLPADPRPVVTPPGGPQPVPARRPAGGTPATPQPVVTIPAAPAGRATGAPRGAPAVSTQPPGPSTPALEPGIAPPVSAPPVSVQPAGSQPASGPQPARVPPAGQPPGRSQPAPGPARTAAVTTRAIQFRHQIPLPVRHAFTTTARATLLRAEPLYRDVASDTGIDWQLLAACDWMQCEAKPRYSPVRGERLGTVNPDGTVYRTKSAALAQCAQDLAELALTVYGIDLTTPGTLSVRDLASTFAAFRWGGLLKQHHTSAMEFPYSVAGLTHQHTSMRWPDIADPNTPDKPGSRFRKRFGAVPIVLSLNLPATV